MTPVDRSRTAVSTFTSSRTPEAPRTATQPAAQTGARERSEFVPAAKQTVLARAEQASRATALPSIAPGGAEEGLSLDSSAAKKAIAASLAYFGQTRSLTASGAQLLPHNVERDELGMTHVRLDRTQDGLRVYGKQVIAHLGSDGKVKDSTGDTEPLTFASGARQPPTVTADAAIAAAKAAFEQANPGVPPKNTPTAELLFYKAADGQYHKAYRVELTNLQDADEPLKMNYMVDAHDGKVLRAFNTVDAFVRKSAPGGATPAAQSLGAISSKPPASSGASMYSGRVHLTTHKNKDGTWSLQDDLRGKGKTMDAMNQDPASGNRVFKDKNNVWGEATDPKRAKAAIDAHYGMEMTWDMYSNLLGRKSIDGKGEALNSYVHVGSKYVNAYWDGEKMNYGDGDGKDASPLTSIDVAGHEISHGLTERTAGLIYDGESGGLNEAMSDILGTGVEWYASRRNPNVKFDWKIGEDVWTPGKPGDALRYMNDPTKDGYSIDHYKNYPNQTEVHGSSGIANNAFYLLAHGGKNRTSGLEVKGGIGMAKGLKIYYRALAHYMTPDTTFKQARTACIKAATDLYGAKSVEVQKVKESWAAVGVR